MQTWIIYALLSMLFAGFTSVIAKFGLKNVSGDLGLAIRTCTVFVLVWINTIAFKHYQQMGNLTQKDIMFLCISGLTTTLSWIFYYKAIKIGNVSEVALIDKGSIIITLLLSFFILNEPFTMKVLVGAGLIMAGLLVLTIK